MVNMITTIILDFENSILESENVETTSILPLIEKYKMNANEIMESFIKYMKGDIEREKFLLISHSEELERAFLDSIKITDKTKDILKNLSNKFSLVLFSNLPPEWFWYIIKKNGIEDFFKSIVLSRPVGVKRHSKEASKILKSSISESFDNSVFVSSDKDMKNFIEIKFIPYDSKNENGVSLEKLEFL